MHATMTYDDTPRTPEHASVGFGAAVQRQFLLLWSTKRPLILIIFMLGALTLSGDPWMDDAGARLFMMWPVWIAILGPLWAFAVWHGETPSKRHYMWSQPVPRLTHTLARVTAGLAWLWVANALLILIGIGFALSDGDFVQITTLSTAGWVNWFTGPLLGYLLASILTVASDYPIRWAAALFFGVPLLVAIMVDWLNVDPDRLEWVAEPIANESWGFGTALVGGFLNALTQLGHVLRGREGPVELPLPETWWLAAIGWIVVLSGAVAYLAQRHPDTFPRWRGR